MKKIFWIAVMLFIVCFSDAEEAKKPQPGAKPTGTMVDCDRRINKAAVQKVLSVLPLKFLGTDFSLKSKVYYPAEVDDESFDVGIVAGGQDYDVTVTMDEKCKKVIGVKIDK